MIFLLLPTGLTFAICASELIRDESTPNNDMGSWFFITFASILWPVALPSILRKKYSDWANRDGGFIAAQRVNAEQPEELSALPQSPLVFAR